MTKAQLIKEIFRREAGKSSVTIGNVREIICIIEDICAEYHFFFNDVVDADSVIAVALDEPLRPGVKAKMKKLFKRK
jgi:hypothetical protein